MRYDTEHRDRTRRKVLTEAAAAIREHGPGGIGVSDLMKRAGLTAGGFYAHFESKDALVGEALGQMFDERFDHLQRCFEGRPLQDGLRRFVDRYLGKPHRERADLGCPMPALAGEVARLPHEARERFRIGTERLLARLAEVLGELGHADPELLAASVTSELVGAMALARALPDSTVSDRLLAASRASVLARLGL